MIGCRKLVKRFNWLIHNSVIANRASVEGCDFGDLTCINNMFGKKYKIAVDESVDTKLDAKANKYINSRVLEVSDQPEVFVDKVLTFAENSLSPLLANRCQCEFTNGMGSSFKYKVIGSKKFDSAIECGPRELLLRAILDVKKSREELRTLNEKTQIHIVTHVGAVLTHVLDKHRNTSKVEEIYKFVKLILNFSLTHRLMKKNSFHARAMARAILSYEQDTSDAEEGNIGLATMDDDQKYLNRKVDIS